MLKGPQELAPVYLEHAHRIEALMLCHFLAMIIEALIEREIRNTMKEETLAGIALYPELRNSPSPAASRILEIFAGVQRHQLVSDKELIQVFEPQLEPLQLRVLSLLHVPAAAYASSGTPSRRRFPIDVIQVGGHFGHEKCGTLDKTPLSRSLAGRNDRRN